MGDGDVQDTLDGVSGEGPIRVLDLEKPADLERAVEGLQRSARQALRKIFKRLPNHARKKI